MWRNSDVQIQRSFLYNIIIGENVMIILRNPYEGILEKHRSIDDMDMILESRTGGTDYGRLSVLSATANDEQPLRTNTAVSRQVDTITE